jgi:hypothetical protein
VTALFLRPIYKVLRKGGDAGAQHSAGYKKLLKTKWATLLGAFLAVMSSTALYTNAGMYFVWGGEGTPVWVNPYLNMMVFGLNLDSVLNDIGMLLVCGVLKKVDCSSLVSHISTIRSVHKVGPASQPQPAGAYADLSVVFGSQEGDQTLSIHSNLSSVDVSSVAQD